MSNKGDTTQMPDIFTPTGLGLSIFNERYTRVAEETWENGSHRVSRIVASGELNGRASQAEDSFFGEIHGGYFMPGGRTWYGAGRPVQQLLNCFVLKAEDSREGWGRAISDVIITCGMGGGVGFNMSLIRGRNYPIRRMGGESTGSVSLMNMINNVGDELVGGGGRRLALMLCLDVTHPDIQEFLNAKLDLHKLQNANVSIVIPNDYNTEKFVEDVREGREIPLRFNGMDDIFGRKLQAKPFWKTIVENAHKSGEPGVLNGYLANEQNSIKYAHALISTNPCQPDFATVLTPQGIRLFGDIGIGSVIWSGKHWTTVVNKWHTGVKPVYRYETTAGVFIGTDQHRVVCEGVKVPVRDTAAIDISKGQLEDNILYLRKTQDIMDGLVLGDGSVHKASNNLVYLIIGRNDQSYHLDVVSKLLIKERPGLHTGAWEVQTTITSDELPKTYERRVPDRFKFADASTILGFLRGLYSANGSICGGRVTLKSASKQIIEDVQLMLSAVGIQSYYTTNKTHAVKFSNGEYTCRQSYDLNITSDIKLFQRMVGFIQPYKTAKLQEIIDLKRATEKKKTTYDIISKTHLGDFPVYDITVNAEDHTYWSGGLLVSNCGEIWLPNYGCCCLGALVLPRFVKNGKMNWDKLDETVRVAVRFLDNVLTVNHYPLNEIKEMCEKERRIGLGVMGLHSMLMDLGLPYESEESYALVDKLFDRIKVSAYHASIDLAIEKGPFPLYDPRMLESGFARTLKPSIRRRITDYGIRNCALLTIAPTGTTSMVHGVTGGIEPLFAPAYIRRRFVKTKNAGEKKHTETLVVSKDYTDHPDIAQGSYDVSVRGHFEMQKICQKHIDNAVSKTINLPRDFSVSALSEVWLDYLPHMKGSTFYREGSRENEPMQHVPLQDVKKLIDSWKGETEFEQSYVSDCPSGVCELPQL